jgi:GH24 family phage-related lysozyme (muramidase)
MLPAIPDDALSLIEQFEIGPPGAYVPHPVWPGGASGMTIGIGYDLGYATAKQIATDWATLPRLTIIRLQSCAGHTGDVARMLLSAYQNIDIPYVDACDVFYNIDLPRCAALTAATFPNCEELSGDSFAALVSLVMNRGASMIDPPGYPNARLEMRQIRDACAARNFAAVPGYIRAMTRLWTNGLVARREAEADLFEKGLT